MSDQKKNGTHNPKHNSIPLTEGPKRAAARAMLHAVGYTREDLAKPIIGIANTWTEIGPCNFHLRIIAEAVKQGIRDAGGTPMEFNTITISDGITMGTQGMKASLISREVIADSVELVARGNLFDGLVAIAGCDKNLPGTVMALARLDIPSLMLYGGSIAPGHLHGKDLTIQDVFEAQGSYASGKIDDAELEAVENHACPGAGACGGQFTANTMAMACEFLGISPIGLTGVPALSPEKSKASRAAGATGARTGEKRSAPVEDHHARIAGKCHCQRCCFWRIDKCRPPLYRHRARSGHRTLCRRLRPHQPPDSAALRHEARWSLRGHGLSGGRRQPFARAALAGWQEN